MKDVFMFCNDPECVCEDLCCQNCDKLSTCDKKCDNVKYKERIYNDSNFMLEELGKRVDKFDDWLLAVVYNKLHDLLPLVTGQKVIILNPFTYSHSGLEYQMPGITPGIVIHNEDDNGKYLIQFTDTINFDGDGRPDTIWLTKDQFSRYFEK